ncbi:exported hypothetical protein [Azospirillaceae bacterium]
MNKNIIITCALMLVMIGSALATSTITISSPTNASKTTDRTPTITYKLLTDNETTPSCKAMIGGYSVTGITTTNNTAKTTSAFGVIPDGTYQMNVTCNVDAAASTGNGHYVLTIDAFSYASTDIAPSALDLIVGIVVGLIGFGSLIALVLLFRMVKK